MKKITLIGVLLLVLAFFNGCGTTQSLQDRLISEHPEWTNKQVALIKANEIEVGMTQDMVIAAWGEPNYKNENNSAYTGNTLAWTYYSIFSSNIKTVTFKDNEVTMFNVSHPN